MLDRFTIVYRSNVPPDQGRWPTQGDIRAQTGYLRHANTRR